MQTPYYSVFCTALYAKLGMERDVRLAIYLSRDSAQGAIGHGHDEAADDVAPRAFNTGGGEPPQSYRGVSP